MSVFGKRRGPEFCTRLCLRNRARPYQSIQGTRHTYLTKSIWSSTVGLPKRTIFRTLYTQKRGMAVLAKLQKRINLSMHRAVAFIPGPLLKAFAVATVFTSITLIYKNWNAEEWMCELTWRGCDHWSYGSKRGSCCVCVCIHKIMRMSVVGNTPRALRSAHGIRQDLTKAFGAPVTHSRPSAFDRPRLVSRRAPFFTNCTHRNREWRFWQNCKSA